MLEHYQFKKDHSFEYSTNSDDGLHRVRAIGGTYTYSNGMLKLLVKYTREITGGTLNRSTIYSSNDSWSIEDGTYAKRALKSPLWFGIEVKFVSSTRVSFDSRMYYKIN